MIVQFRTRKEKLIVLLACQSDNFESGDWRRSHRGNHHSDVSGIDHGWNFASNFTNSFHKRWTILS